MNSEVSNNERDPFGLASLAQPQASGDSWPQIEAALKRQKQLKRFRWMASAATVALALGIFWQLPLSESGLQKNKPAQALAESTLPTQSAEPQQDDEPANLAALINLSQQLERNLQLIRGEVAVMPEQALIYQVELEDLVAQVDEAINQNPESLELWSQRVNLLLDLNQIYKVQLRRDYSHVASL